MRRKSKFTTLNLLGFYKVFLGLAIIEGLLALWFLFRVASDSENAFFAGYSLPRIGIGFVILFILAIFFFLLLDSLRSQRILSYFASKLDGILSDAVKLTIIKTTLLIVLTTSIITILFFLFPPLKRLHPFLQNGYIYASIRDRIGGLIGWVFLICLKILMLYAISGKKPNQTLSTPVCLMIVSWAIVIFVVLDFALWSLILKKVTLDILQGPGVKILILSVWFSLWVLLSRQKERAKQISLLFTCISIWLCVFLISLQFAQYLGRWYSPRHNYFNYLASAFLSGELFLSDQPGTTDLTFYNGHWFLPQPPLPAILMIPFVAILGIKAFNTVTFSLALAATTAVILYMILQELIHLGWIKLTRSGSIWLTTLLSFGTPYVFVSIDNRSPFFTQVVAVLFCALAFLATIKRSSPWISGICLAAAIMTRPNLITLWPALLAITIQLHSKEEKVNWKYYLRWSVISVIPVIIGVGFLLYYNFIRFGNYFDFGYATVNTGKWILEKIQAYGLFSFHFIPDNLFWMLVAPFKLPAECNYFLTRGMGMSIFATTPAIIYTFRKFKISWWTIGCWCSILLSIFLLSLYSNNGALQYGYRYLLDFSVPVIMLIAYNAGNRISVPLKILIIASILINYYGTISFYRGPC